jgi:flavin-dependent dehydrogenase
VSSSSGFAAVIVGGGPAGAATAITLASLGHRVILVDDSAGCFKIGEALAPSAGALLRDLGVMDRFLADGHLPCYGNVSAWGSSEAQCTDFVFNPHGNGWHLDRSRFDAMLQDEACIRGGEALLQARFASAEHEQGGWRITIRTADGARELHANWLIDATGRSSFVARQLGAERIHDDHLIAFFIRCRITEAAQRDADSRTFAEAMPDGWWYSALVPSGERIVAFLTDSDLADRATLRTTQGFLELLAETKYLGHVLKTHGYRPDGDPRGTDAGTARLDRFAGAGWLWIC